MSLPLPKGYSTDFRLPNKKPIGDVEIDWSNPFSRDIAWAIIGKNEVVTDALVESTDISERWIGVSPNGVAMEGSSNATTAHFTIDNLGSQLTIPTTFTLFFEFYIIDLSRFFVIFSSNGTAANSLILEVTDNGTLRMGDSSSSRGLLTSSSGAISAKKQHNIAMVQDTTTGVSSNRTRIYIDGEKVDNDAWNITWNFSDLWLMAYDGAAFGEANGFVNNSIAINRALTDEQVLAFSKNPYQILKPKTPPIFFPAVSTGITVTPDSINTASASNNPTIEFKSVVEVAPSVINTSSIALDPVINFGSVLNILPSAINTNSVSLDPTILFSSELIILPSAVNTASVANNPTITFNDVVNVSPNQINTSSVSLNPTIAFTSSLIINPLSINTNSVSLDPVIEFKSIIELTPAAINTQSVSFNPAISLGQSQVIGVVGASFAPDETTVGFAPDAFSVQFKSN